MEELTERYMPLCEELKSNGFDEFETGIELTCMEDAQAAIECLLKDGSRDMIGLFDSYGNAAL